MTTLNWTEADASYVCDGYAITRLNDRAWLLTLDRSRYRAVDNTGSHEDSVFGSLRSARAAALHLEVVRIRRIKLVRHVSMAILAFVMSVALYLVMSAATQANRLEWFVLAGVALIVALSEGLDAFVLIVADGWDHRYEVPSVSFLDRAVSWTVVSLLWPRADSPRSEPSQVKVQPVV